MNFIEFKEFSKYEDHTTLAHYGFAVRIRESEDHDDLIVVVDLKINKVVKYEAMGLSLDQRIADYLA